MVPNRRAEVLSRVPKCKEAVMCLLEKMSVRSACSDMRFSAAGPEFNVNESTIYIK